MELSLGGGGEAVVVELEAGAESAVAEGSDLPAACVWDFGDQAADVEAFETATDGGPCAAAVKGVAVREFEYPAEVRVAKALELVFPA